MISATKWEVTPLIDFIAKGKSIWQHLFEMYGLDYREIRLSDPALTKILEAAMEETLYSFVF